MATWREGERGRSRAGRYVLKQTPTIEARQSGASTRAAVTSGGHRVAAALPTRQDCGRGCSSRQQAPRCRRGLRQQTTAGHSRPALRPARLVRPERAQQVRPAAEAALAGVQLQRAGGSQRGHQRRSGRRSAPGAACGRCRCRSPPEPHVRAERGSPLPAAPAGAGRRAPGTRTPIRPRRLLPRASRLAASSRPPAHLLPDVSQHRQVVQAVVPVGLLVLCRVGPCAEDEARRGTRTNGAGVQVGRAAPRGGSVSAHPTSRCRPHPTSR